jgi:hypothetical protein
VGRLALGISVQGGDSVEQFAAMANGANADVLKVVSRQARQDRFVDFVFAKRCSILLEAEPLQPPSEVHDVACMCLLEPANTTCSASRNRITTAKALRRLFT